MKFFATVTSERASKGQGGKYLDIKVQNEKKEIISRFFVQITHDGLPIIASWNKTKPFEMTEYGSLTSLIHHYTEDKKGEKQKGANDCAIDCKQEHLCKGLNCKQDNPHNC